jgi:hypothetical protein
LLLNQKGMGFSPDKIASGLHSSAGHRGISLGDLDNDGDMDIVLASDKTSAPLLLFRGRNADAGYVDRARDMGIAVEHFAGLSGWTPGALDFNNDGWLDLFFANGLTLPDQDISRVPTGQPKQFWINDGEGQFQDATQHSGVALADSQSARGAAFADFDNDGDVDVYVAHNNDLGQLLINQSPANRHWIGFRLEGTKSNRDAVGARVEITTDSGPQNRLLVAGNGFLSDSDRRINFGLGKASLVKAIHIAWPDGSQSAFHGLQADRYYRIRQGDDAAKIESASQPKPTAKPAALGLAFGQDDPVNRISYLQIAASVLGVDAILPELEVAARDDDARVREAVVRLLEGHKSSNALHLLPHALDDSAASVAVKAVEALCA